MKLMCIKKLTVQVLVRYKSRLLSRDILVWGGRRVCSANYGVIGKKLGDSIQLL
jgi:hypothetical protein